TAYYVRPGAVATSISLVTQTVTGAYSSGGFVEVSAANMPGVYRFDVPNAVLATGVNSVVVMLKGATNMEQVVLEIQLVSFNPNDAVRLGLTAIPNATAGGAGGVPIIGTGTNNFKSDGSANVTFANTSIATVANLTNAPTNGDLTATMKTSVTTAATAATPAVTVSDKTGFSLSTAGILAIWNQLTSALTTASTIGKLLVDNINATISSRSSHVAADIWSVATRLLTAGTNIVLAKGTGVTGFNDLSAAEVNAEADQALADYDPPTKTEMDNGFAALNDISPSEVNAELDIALADIHLDHLLAVDYDPASKPGVATALMNELVESDAGISRFTANALEQAPTGGSAPTVEEIRTEIDTNSTQLAAIVADTNELQTDDIPGLIAALNDLSAADVNTEVDTALVDYDAPTKAELDAAETSILAKILKWIQLTLRSDAAIATDNATELTEINANEGSGAGDYNNVTDSQEGIADSGGGGPTAEQIADQVWDEAIADHVGAGSFGEEIQAHALSSEISALNDLSAAEVNAEVDTALTDYDAPTHAELQSEVNDVQADIAALNDPTAAAIADAVWDEDVVAAHNTADTAGALIDDLATPNNFKADVSNLDVAVSTRSPESGGNIAAILADTNELQTDDVPGLIAALENLSAVEVNAEVKDILETDTHAEPGSVPAATSSLKDKINWLFALARNKIIQSSSAQTLRNDADNGDIAEAVLSKDDTTVTRGEWT
ncbi:MAG: hypothetical protein OEM46_03275, partial [Ignavibacteria bacterium]|nr:hypothetical protein [Ignavibacteria bacterium]